MSDEKDDIESAVARANEIANRFGSDPSVSGEPKGSGMFSGMGAMGGGMMTPGFLAAPQVAPPAPPPTPEPVEESAYDDFSKEIMGRQKEVENIISKHDPKSAQGAEKTDFPTIDAAKNWALESIEKGAEAISFGSDKPTPDALTSQLHQLSPSNITPEIKAEAAAVMDPVQLKQWPAWFTKTDAQHRAEFDQKHVETSMAEKGKEAWNVGVGVGKGLLDVGARFGSGVAKAGATFLKGPGSEGSIADPKEWQRWGTGIAKLATVPAVSVAESLESVVQTASNAFQNGLSATDWVNEQLPVEQGGITREEAFQNYLGRKRADEYYAGWRATDPNVFTRVIMEDPKTRELAENMAYSLTSIWSPSVDDRIQRHNGDRDAAMREKQLDDLRDSQQLVSNFRKEAAQMVPDPDMTEAAGWTRFGMNPFDIYGRVGGAGMRGISKGIKAASRVGKTAEQIAAMEAEAAAKAFEAELKAAEAAKTPGWVEGLAGKVADKVEPAAAWMSARYSDLPESVQEGLAKMGSGMVGTPLTKTAAILANAGVAAPRIAQAALAGRRLAASGVEGGFEAGAKAATEAAAKTGLSPKAQQWLANKSIPAAKTLDWMAQNSMEMARGSVHGATLAAAVGVLENKDIEEIADMMGQGIFLHLGGEVMGNMTGVSHGRYMGNLKRQRASAAKWFNELDPTTQAHVRDLGNWDSYVKSLKGLRDSAENKYAQRKNEADNVVYSGESPEKIQAAQEKANDALIELNIRNAQVRNAEKANSDTQKMYRDNLNIGMADVMTALNGSSKAGRNVEMRFTTADELAREVLANNRDKGLTDLELIELFNFVAGASGEFAFIAENGGKHTLTSGKTVDLYTPYKDRININIDSIKDRMGSGESALNAFGHEAGHAFWNIKEFREGVAETYKELFGNQKFDERGNLIGGDPGLFSVEDLLNKFKDYYARGYDIELDPIQLASMTPEQQKAEAVKRLAQKIGLWDPVMQELDPNKTAAYMRHEMMAELIQGGAQGGIKLGADPKPWLAPLVDWATVKQKNTKTGKKIRNAFGLTESAPWDSALTGTRFSSEQIESTRNALRAVSELNGDINAAELIPHAPITETQLRSNEAVANQFGEAFFAHEKVATVLDKDGNVIESRVITDPNAMEGTFEHGVTETGDPELRQTAGYGPIPAETHTMPVPEGGRVTITSRIKRDASGGMASLTPDQAKALNKARANIIRKAILEAPDREYPGRMDTLSEDGLSLGGRLSPKQIEAIKGLPETIIPFGLKRRILEFNDLLVRDDGDAMIGLYGQAMDRKGRYKSFAPKIVDFVPLGMRLSKDGNILFNMFSKTGMREKLRRWQRDTPELLSLWNGDGESFMGDVRKVLENWKPREGAPAGLPGETGLDADLNMAISKKNRVNDFLNIFRKTEPESLTANPARTTMRRPARRLTKAEKLDEESSDPNTLIRSYRVDRFHDLEKSSDAPFRVNYGKALYNLMPAKSEVEQRAELPPAFEESILKGLRSINAFYMGSGAPTARLPLDTAETFVTRFKPRQNEEDAMVSHGFYSKAGAVLLDKMPNRASAAQLKGILDPQKGSGVKPEELKWSGINQFIDATHAEKGFVTKDDIRKWLKEDYAAKFTTQTEYGDLGGTMYDRYNGLKLVLPGGKNYKEIVLGMPLKTKIDPIASFKKLNDGSFNVTFVDGEEGNYRTLEQARIDGRGESDIAGVEEFRSTHFPDVPNYVAHLRTAEHGTGLLIEEAQSDRHQKARERGYKEPIPVEELLPKMESDLADLTKEKERLFEQYKQAGKELRSMPGVASELTEAQRERVAKLREFQDNFEETIYETNAAIDGVKEDIEYHKSGKRVTYRGSVPDAPFRKDWPLQLFKYALKDAVESDKEWVGWTGGKEQAKRYKISSKIDELAVSRKGDTYLIAGIKGGSRVASKSYSESELPNVVGKDLAQKIIKDHKAIEGYDPSNGVLRQRMVMGEPLPGMENYYDFVDPSGRVIQEMIFLPTDISRETMEAYLQKQFAEEGNYDAASETKQTSYSGLDLDLGGEGMKGFYDIMLPKEIGKYVKQWGAKVEPGTVEGEVEYAIKGNPNIPETMRFNDEAQAFKMFFSRGRGADGEVVKIEGEKTKIWKIAITPEMRESVAGGQTRFMPSSAELPVSKFEDEYRRVPSQEELDVMKAKLPKYSATVDVSKYRNNLYLIKLFDESDNQIGYAHASRNPKDPTSGLEVETTHINGDYRGKGYGQAMYREIAKLAQELGLSKLTASTTSRLAANARSKILETNWRGAGWKAESNVPSDIRFMPSVAVVPERFTGTGEEEQRRGRYVEPPKAFKRFDISQYEPGGKFFDAETGEDLTNKSYENASIAVVNGKPMLVANNEAESTGTGPLFRTNLFKQKAGWKWVSEGAPDTNTIVSVEGQGKHLYALQADFQNGVKMARYEGKASEPRLRPTGRGELTMGEQIGTIDIRGREHPVYDRVTIGAAPEPMEAEVSATRFMPEKEEREQWESAIEAARKTANNELNRLRSERVNTSDVLFEHQPSDDPEFGDTWNFVPPKDKYIDNTSMYDVYESGGKYYVGEGYGGGFASLNEAKEEATQRAMGESWKGSRSTFDADTDAQRAVGEIFDSFPRKIGDVTTGDGWFTTKWGSWYLEGKIPAAKGDDYDTFKLSIRDHDSGTRFQRPDKSFFVSKEWTPDETAEALKKAADWIANEAQFDAPESGQIESSQTRFSPAKKGALEGIQPELKEEERRAAFESIVSPKGTVEKSIQAPIDQTQAYEPTTGTIPAGSGGRTGDGRRGRASGEYTPLEGAPNVDGATGPDPRINSIFEQYARSAGIPVRRQAEYVKVDRDLGRRIAEAYDAMPHAPNDPVVKEAYEDMIRQTADQYKALVDGGYKFWFMDPENDPYKGNPQNAVRDLRRTQSMAVFPTEAGFGTGDSTAQNFSDNLLLVDTGIKWPYGSPDGPLKRVFANDLFRAVHDAAHSIEGAGFRERGEENAWQAHSRLYYGPALGAMTSETRGQNSWLNFGPYGEQNKKASVFDTVFAEQKTGLMPEWTWKEGVAPDEASEQPATQAALAGIRFMPQGEGEIGAGEERKKLPKTISDERGMFSVVIGAKPGEHGYSYRSISQFADELKTVAGQKAAIETWGDLQLKKQRQLELIAKADDEAKSAKKPEKAAQFETKKAAYAEKVAALDAEINAMFAQFPENMRSMSPEDAAWKAQVKKLNRQFEDLTLKSTPAPFTANPLGIRSMAEFGDSVHDILKSDGFNGILKDFFGIEGLQIRPISGTWMGRIEPSFDMAHPDLTFDKAKQITQLLTLTFAQDAGITYKPSIDLKEGVQAAYLIHPERLTDEQLKLAFDKAREVGVDISTTTDGKGIKALNFKTKNFFNKLGEIQAAASIDQSYKTLVESELYETENIFKGRDGKRSLPVWLQATSGGQSLLQRSVDSLLVEYAKAAAAQGYIFDPALYAKRYGLSQADVQYVTEKLYPTDPLARSASPLLAGTEILPVKSTYTLAGKRETAVPDMIHALQNRAASDGVIQPGDYSQKAGDIISSVVMDEVQQHMARAALDPKSPNAIGWYDSALKRMKGMYSQLFPWLDVGSPKYDADKSLVFDAVLGIASQGNDVFENGKMATRVVLMLEQGKQLPEIVKTLKDTFGDKTAAIENNLLKLHELLTRHTPSQLRNLLFKTDTVSNWNKYLKQDDSLYYNGAPLSVKGGSNQKVTGFMVFGPKIGSFINNLHGDYSTLTADLWYTRTWNRILGRSFKYDPLREGNQFERFQDTLIEEYNRNQALKKGKEYTDRVNTNKKGEEEPYLYGEDAPDISKKEFQKLLEDDNAMLSLAASLEKEFRTGGYKEKSELRRAAKNWVQDRTTPLAAPRASLERAFQQTTMEEAQDKLQKAGIGVSIADMQAALWFNEKELFGKYGAATSGAEPADYADAASFILDIIKAGGLFQVTRGNKVVRLLDENSEANLTGVKSPNKNLMKELMEKDKARKAAEKARKEAEGEEEEE